MKIISLIKHRLGMYCVDVSHMRCTTCGNPIGMNGYYFAQTVSDKNDNIKTEILHECCRQKFGGK